MKTDSSVLAVLQLSTANTTFAFVHQSLSPAQGALVLEGEYKGEETAFKLRASSHMDVTTNFLQRIDRNWLVGMELQSQLETCQSTLQAIVEFTSNTKKDQVHAGADTLGNYSLTYHHKVNPNFILSSQLLYLGQLGESFVETGGVWNFANRSVKLYANSAGKIGTVFTTPTDVQGLEVTAVSSIDHANDNYQIGISLSFGG